MKRFSRLFADIDRTTSVNAKVAALAGYFREAPEADRLWTIALLSGRRPKRTMPVAQLRDWAAAVAGMPAWLFEDSYAVVGDLAETIALVLPPPRRESDGSLAEWIGLVRGLGRLDEADRRAAVLDAWDRLERDERFLFNKLITGGFRMGVSQTLMTRALAEATGRAPADIAHRLMGGWTPDSTSFAALVLESDPGADASRPYPFFLAYQIEAEPERIGLPQEWLAEWKWDGIRGQLIRRGGGHFLWSRGEELLTDRFPEFDCVDDFLPDGTVIDGEVLGWRDGRPLPFAALQRRIGRKSASKAVLAEVPVSLLAFDLLEWDGADLRQQPLAERRARLADLIAGLPSHVPVRLSPEVPFAGWYDLAQARAQARDRGAEGLMLKRRGSPYLSGRRKGDWWKWKVDPMSVDAVMVYAQAGHGRRATLYTDFTFAVRDGDAFVPFAKAYSGLTDADFAEVTRWVQANTLERFGPVRQVRPELVFELAFEGIQASPRHKSGVALRFPRMLRWRRDKTASEANTIDDLRQLLAAYG